MVVKVGIQTYKLALIDSFMIGNVCTQYAHHFYKSFLSFHPLRRSLGSKETIKNQFWDRNLNFLLVFVLFNDYLS